MAMSSTLPNSEHVNRLLFLITLFTHNRLKLVTRSFKMSRPPSKTPKSQDASSEDGTTADDTGLAPREKQRTRHPDIAPPAFWDNLSETHFTRNALRELDRRNALMQGNRPPPEHLFQFLPGEEMSVDRFARSGGPDLTNLRGVRTD